MKNRLIKITEAALCTGSPLAEDDVSKFMGRNGKGKANMSNAIHGMIRLQKLLVRYRKNPHCFPGCDDQLLLDVDCALLTNPRPLNLTNGLSPKVCREIRTALGRLKQEAHIAILVVDKSLKDLQHVFDHAVPLARGKTFWSGKTAVLSSEMTEKYVGL